MTPTLRAVKALQELYALDPGSMERLLMYSVVLGDSSHPVHEVSCYKLINEILEAMYGEQIATTSLQQGAWVFGPESPSPVCDDFDAEQSWDDVSETLDYCSRQPDPAKAAELIAIANIQMGESGWACSFLQSCPDTWEPKQTHVLQAAANLIPGLVPDWDYPGYLHIRTAGFDFMFGEGDAGVIVYDYLIPGDEEGDMRRSGDKTFSATLSCARLADAIRTEIKKTKEAHGYKSYRAVPLLVYVPLTVDAAADEARATEPLRDDVDLRFYVAEDFDTVEVAETPEDDLSAMISSVCQKP